MSTAFYPHLHHPAPPVPHPYTCSLKLEFVMCDELATRNAVIREPPNSTGVYFTLAVGTVLTYHMTWFTGHPLQECYAISGTM
jgi:hypothetical protein